MCIRCRSANFAGRFLLKKVIHTIIFSAVAHFHANTTVTYVQFCSTCQATAVPLVTMYSPVAQFKATVVHLNNPVGYCQATALSLVLPVFDPQFSFNKFFSRGAGHPPP